MNSNTENNNGSKTTAKVSTNYRPQILASLSATLGTFCSGSVLGWTSTANPQLLNGNDAGELTESNLSWVASIAVIGALISGFAAGYLIDKIGRKLTLIFLNLPFIAGWVLVTIAFNLEMLLVGRFITGFCCGAYTLAVPVYISEICQDKLRGTMSGCMVVSLVTGVLFSYFTGALVSWKWLSAISGTLPIFFALAFIFMPDSPRFLLSKERTEEARQSLTWLRGPGSHVEEEIKEMMLSLDETVGGTFKELFVASNTKPVGICLLLMIFQQFGGINAVIFFTVDIFKTSGSELDPNVASIIVGSVQVISVFISTMLVEKAGRKILMTLSEIGMTLSLIALGLFFYLKNENGGEAPEGLGWLPIVSMICYIITFNLGCASLPWTYMGELCPPNIKGIASALVTAFSWFLAFIVTYTFADLRILVGDHFVFWGFGLCSAVGALFSLFYLPETKGRSLEEIQELFSTKSLA